MRQDDVKNLWIKAKNDDFIAFEKIYRCYNLLLRRYAKNYLQDNHLIDEAVQGLFVEIYEKRKNLTISKNLPALFAYFFPALDIHYNFIKFYTI